MAEAAPRPTPHSGPDAWSPFGEAARALPMRRVQTTLSIADTPAAFVLRADVADAAFLKAVKQTLGLTLSLAVGEVSHAEEKRIFWLGPDMWLLLVPPSGATDVAQALTKLTARFLHASNVETTETRVWLSLEGSKARATLMRLMSRDLRDTAFPIGACAGARLGPLHVLLERTGEDAYLIAGSTSSAEFLANLACDALATL